MNPKYVPPHLVKGRLGRGTHLDSDQVLSPKAVYKFNSRVWVMKGTTCRKAIALAEKLLC